MKSNNEKLTEQMTYVAPEMRIIDLKIEGMVCVSNYGAAGRAGDYLDIYNDDEEDY